MKYLGAYLLATLGGNASPSAKDILAILGLTFQELEGLDCDMEDATKVVEALAGKSLPEVMEEGKKKLSSVPSGGGAEAKKEEPKEESDEDMGFGLFD
ncbi:60s Acidic ribosomal protein [Ostertagia ostertagi]